MPDIIKIKVKEEAPAAADSDEISWQFEDRPIAPKNEWLWALIILGFAIVIFSIMMKNYLLAVIIFLAAFIIYVLKNRMPLVHDFKIDNFGIHVDSKVYSHDNFESFCIFPDKELALRSRKHLMPLLVIPFNADDESDIKKIISEHLPEIEEEEPFLDLLRKKFF